MSESRVEYPSNWSNDLLIGLVFPLPRTRPLAGFTELHGDLEGRFPLDLLDDLNDFLDLGFLARVSNR